MVGFGMLLVTIGFLASAIASAGLFLMYRRHQTKSSERIRSLEDQIGELHKGLLEAKLEKSQAMRTAEQVPIIVQKLTEHMPAESYPPAIVRHVKEITNAVRVGYFVPLPDPEYLVLRVGYGFPDDWQGKMRIAAREGSVGQALRKRVVLAREDFESDVFPGSLPSLEQEGIDPDLVAPVYGISGIEGVLVIAGCNLPPGSLKVNISMIADLLSLSLRNAALPEPKEQVAYFDSVTGLANRFHFMKVFEREIRRALNYQQPLSLVRFDIDRSPETDSAADSQAEYAILREFAGIVKGYTRSSHFLARFGESEFAVLLPSTKKESAFRYAGKVRDRIASTEFSVDGREKPARRTISGGISAFPEDGRSINELVRAAGDALDEARKGGGNRIVLPQSEGTRFRTGAMERQSGTETVPHPEAKSDSA
jgi:diguanylate cyclase (GGDEF)-like protein